MIYNNLYLRYFFIISFLVFLTGVVIIPEKEKNKEINPVDLLNKSISLERFITTDDVADIIINQDPSYQFIDVRDKESFKKYSLPNAINIPLSDILKEESKAHLNQDKLNVVLFSNDNFYADQAWILCSRLGYKNLYVLDGGINKWFNTIINPPIPTPNLPATEMELYTFRKAASMYFGVSYPEPIFQIPEKKKIVPKKIIPVKKKKKMPVEGGC